MKFIKFNSESWKLHHFIPLIAFTGCKPKHRQENTDVNSFFHSFIPLNILFHIFNIIRVFQFRSTCT